MMGCVLSIGAAQPKNTDVLQVQSQDSVELRSNSKHYLVLELFRGTWINGGTLIYSIDESYTITFGYSEPTDWSPGAYGFYISKAGKVPLFIKIEDWMDGKIYFSTTIVGELWESGEGWCPTCD